MSLSHVTSSSRSLAVCRSVSRTTPSVSASSLFEAMAWRLLFMHSSSVAAKWRFTTPSISLRRFGTAARSAVSSVVYLVAMACMMTGWEAGLPVY